jgi:hypothetical protein
MRLSANRAIDAIAMQDLLNTWQDRVESLFSDDADYRFSDEVLGLASKHWRAGSTQIGTASCKHEWGIVYHCVQIAYPIVRRLFAAKAFPQLAAALWTVRGGADKVFSGSRRAGSCAKRSQRLSAFKKSTFV